MKRFLIAALVLLGACVPTKPPVVTPPVAKLRTVTVLALNQATQKPVQGATVTGLRDDAAQLTNSEGLAIVVNVPSDLHTFHLTVTAPGCTPISESRVLPDGFVDGRSVESLKARLTCAVVPDFLTTGERLPLIIDGAQLLRLDRTLYYWKGASDFALLQRFQRGEDIDPLLDQRIAAGATLLRTLGMYEAGIANAAGLPFFTPTDNFSYYADLARYADKLAVRGLRFEFVVFADAQILMPSLSAQQAHLDKIASALAGKWNVTLELANEPFKNGVEVARLNLTGFLVASGDYNVDGLKSIPVRNYFTLHTERKEEWVRTPRALAELREGNLVWSNGVTFVGVKVPSIGDEPTGFAEAKRGDSRSEDADEAAQYAGNCVLFGAGCTFHSDDGIISKLWGPKQLAAAKAFFWAMDWIPAEAQFAPYQRGSEFGGPGIGDMPLEHTDALALRTYCKVARGFEWCVVSRPAAAWTAVARRGCTIVEQPRRGFVKLSCP